MLVCTQHAGSTSHMTHILTIRVSYNHAPKTWERHTGPSFKHSGLNKENEEILQNVFFLESF